MIENLVLSGRVVDLMIVLAVMEVLLIGLSCRFRGRGIDWLPLLVNMGAGLCLMLALRASLTNSGWQWVAFFLVCSLCLHVADVVVRWGPTGEQHHDARA